MANSPLMTNTENATMPSVRASMAPRLPVDVLHHADRAGVGLKSLDVSSCSRGTSVIMPAPSSSATPIMAALASFSFRRVRRVRMGQRAPEERDHVGPCCCWADPT